MAPERGGTSDLGLWFAHQMVMDISICEIDYMGIYIYIHIFIQRIDMDLYSYIVCIHSIIFHVPTEYVHGI